MPQDNAEIEKKIRNVIRTKVRPILLDDGGNIEFISYEGGDLVNVKLTGSCCGCPMAAVTLRSIVEDTLKLHIPELGENVRVFNVDEGYQCDSSERI
jgi:Fe-S cluster biogenesis protein NfuA